MSVLKQSACFTLATFLISLFFALLLAGSAQASPDQPSAAMQQMATIMHRLKHYPSPQGKQELQAIIDDQATNKNERVLASAMMHLQHVAMADDKAGLKRIMDDKRARADERDLAGIIYHLDHRPSSADKKMLEHMMPHM